MQGFYLANLTSRGQGSTVLPRHREGTANIETQEAGPPEQTLVYWMDSWGQCGNRPVTVWEASVTDRQQRLY